MQRTLMNNACAKYVNDGETSNGHGAMSKSFVVETDEKSKLIVPHKHYIYKQIDKED